MGVKLQDLNWGWRVERYGTPAQRAIIVDANAGDFDGAITPSVLAAMLSKAHDLQGLDPNDLNMCASDVAFIAKMLKVSNGCVYTWFARCVDNPVHSKSNIRRVCHFLNTPLSKLGRYYVQGASYYSDLLTQFMKGSDQAILAAFVTMEQAGRDRLRYLLEIATNQSVELDKIEQRLEAAIEAAKAKAEEARKAIFAR